MLYPIPLFRNLPQVPLLRVLQAVSFLRQRKMDEVARSLNNLVACEKVLPSGAPISWGQREELQDLYSTYVTKVRSRTGRHAPAPDTDR